MAEQILHGSNVVTTTEQGRRERVAEGVRCGGLRDTCFFHGTFEGALKGLVIHIVDAETLRSFASQDRNASTSLRPKVVG